MPLTCRGTGSGRLCYDWACLCNKELHLGFEFRPPDLQSRDHTVLTGGPQEGKLEEPYGGQVQGQLSTNNPASSRGRSPSTFQSSPPSRYLQVRSRGCFPLLCPRAVTQRARSLLKHTGHVQLRDSRCLETQCKAIPQKWERLPRVMGLPFRTGWIWVTLKR